jgi:hypothetical protein
MLGIYGENVERPEPLDYYRMVVSARGEVERMLFLVCRNHDYLILSYEDMESIGNPPGIEPNSVVLLRFRGSVPREVRIEGYRLLDAVRLLWRRELKALQEAPEGWNVTTDGTTTVVTRIAIRETESARPAM